MKIRLLSTMLVALILITACVAHPKPVSQLRKDTRTPMSAGHYSLVFVPARPAAILIPVTGDESPRWNYFNPSNGRMDKIRPRFGRSLFYK